jgi:hypothetical protein
MSGEGWPDLPMLTRRLIAHEAAHLVCYHSLEGFEGHPEWLGEGLAEWIADEVMRRRGWASGETEEPHTASRLAELGFDREDSRTALVERLLSNSLGKESVTRRYALYGSFVAFLAKDGADGALHTLLQRGSSIGVRSPDRSQQYAALFDELVARDGRGELEQAFRRHLATTAPRWYEEARSLEARDLSTLGETIDERVSWSQFAFPDGAALAWRLGDRVPDVGSVEGLLEFPSAGEPRAAQVLLGGRPRAAGGAPPRRLVTEFDPRGVVVLRATHSALPRPWVTQRNRGTDELGRCSLQGLRPGALLAWKIVLGVERLRVEVDGESVLDVPRADHRFAGYLGLGVAAGGLVHWSDPSFSGP